MRGEILTADDLVVTTPKPILWIDFYHNNPSSLQWFYHEFFTASPILNIETRTHYRYRDDSYYDSVRTTHSCEFSIGTVTNDGKTITFNEEYLCTAMVNNIRHPWVYTIYF